MSSDGLTPYQRQKATKAARLAEDEARRAALAGEHEWGDVLDGHHRWQVARVYGEDVYEAAVLMACQCGRIRLRRVVP